MPAHGPGLRCCAEMLMPVAFLLKADASAASQIGLLHASPASRGTLLPGMELTETLPNYASRTGVVLSARRSAVHVRLDHEQLHCIY